MKSCHQSRSFQKIKGIKEFQSSWNTCFFFQTYMSPKRISEYLIIWETVLKALPSDIIKRWNCKAQKFKYTEIYGTPNAYPEGEVQFPQFSSALTINLKQIKNLQYIFILMNSRDSDPTTLATLCTVPSALLNVWWMTTDSDWTKYKPKKVIYSTNVPWCGGFQLCF